MFFSASRTGRVYGDVTAAETNWARTVNMGGFLLSRKSPVSYAESFSVRSLFPVGNHDSVRTCGGIIHWEKVKNHRTESRIKGEFLVPPESRDIKRKRVVQWVYEAEGGCCMETLRHRILEGYLCAQNTTVAGFPEAWFLGAKKSQKQSILIVTVERQ